MFKKMKLKSEIQNQFKTKGFYSDFTSDELIKNFSFIVLTVPSEYLSNIVFIESDSKFNFNDFEVIHLVSKDNTYSIKKKLGLHLLKQKRIDAFEEIARTLLANNLVRLDFLESSYNTKNPIIVFQELVTDIFSFFCSNPNVPIKEISETINSIYVKNHIKKEYSKQSDIDKLFEDL